MRFCWKSFFIAFGLAVLLFSLLMTGVCVGVFNKFVPEAERDVSLDESVDFSEERASYESYIFYCTDKDNDELTFALLVRMDEKGKCFLVTELSGEALLERQGMHFYIHSLYEAYGKEELSPIFATLTGYETSNDRIRNVREYMPVSEQGSTVRCVDFLEMLPSVLENASEDFVICECPLVFEENHEVQILNIEKSLEAFSLLK